MGDSIDDKTCLIGIRHCLQLLATEARTQNFTLLSHMIEVAAEVAQEDIGRSEVVVPEAPGAFTLKMIKGGLS